MRDFLDLLLHQFPLDLYRCIPLLQESLKARQREVKDAEAAITTAVETKGRAESKLAAAKAEHEKALARAKAAGIVPDLPTAPTENGKG